MKYLLLLNRATDALPEPGTPAAQAMLREYTAAVQAMAEVARSTAPTCWPGWAATTRRPGRTAPGWNWSRQPPNGATSSAAWPGTDAQPPRLVHR